MRKYFPNFLIFLSFTLISLLYFFPLLKNFTSSLPDDSDGVVITWHLNKLVLNKSLVPEKLLSGNIMYPYEYVNAYTDPYVTDSLIATPFILLFKEPVVAFNINLIISQILLLFFTFLFFKQLSKSSLVSFVMSVVFGFSNIRLHYLGHLQMFSVYWVPFCGYLLLKFSETKKVTFLCFFFFSFLFQILNSFLPGYFIIFLLAGLFAFDGNLRKAIILNKIPLVIGIFLVSLVASPYIRVYYLVSLIYKYSRPVTDAMHFSLSPEEIFTKFFSLLVLILFFSSLVFFFFSKRNRRATAFLLLAVCSYLVALGPALHYFGKTIKIFMPIVEKWLPIPLPYFIFYYILPGFNGFRTPSRWIFLFGLAGVAFAAIVFSDILKEKSKWIKNFFSVMFLLTVIFSTKRPVFYQIPKTTQYPKVYNWLKDQPGKVILELPIYFWRNPVLFKIESNRMLYSLYHTKLSLNGTTGFTPDLFEEEVVNLQQNFPSEETLAYIKERRVDFLIIHEDELKDFWKNDYTRKIEIIKKNNLFNKVYEENDTLVFKIMGKN